MVLFVGQVPTHQIGREAFQEVDYHIMYGPLAKGVMQALLPGEVADITQRALTLAMDGRPGPVVVVLPENVTTSECKNKEIPAPEPRPAYKAESDAIARAEATGPAKGAELFLPYLSGERTPHNDADVRGAFLNLDHDTDPGRLAQAVLEGVAFALADGLDALGDAGTRLSRLAVIGGGARSAYWGRILAAALGVELAYLEGGEVGPALGAARLAQLAGSPDHRR